MRSLKNTYYIGFVFVVALLAWAMRSGGQQIPANSSLPPGFPQPMPTANIIIQNGAERLIVMHNPTPFPTLKPMSYFLFTTGKKKSLLYDDTPKVEIKGMTCRVTGWSRWNGRLVRYRATIDDNSSQAFASSPGTLFQPPAPSFTLQMISGEPPWKTVLTRENKDHGPIVADSESLCIMVDPLSQSAGFGFGGIASGGTIEDQIKQLETEAADHEQQASILRKRIANVRGVK